MKTAHFRVFDPITKEMYYVGEDGVSIVFGSAGWRLYVEGNPVTIEDEGELMMFTGLHDRNEVPIFEGDIVEAWSQGLKGIFEVKWRQGGSPSYILYPAWQIGEDWSLHGTESADGNYYDTVEIVGNIHEQEGDQ
ncbi:hypothetical protein AAV35_012785 [Salimicrobium jeotgali]|uniref:YopX protein domain-containing protein n=1 Tax=Salimicrobium jeotgali TaxID=1230341 RepID=K2GJ18_9BACI|nr:YopX family protein [Salimicrobium jeotgali]AKG05817.2 hypothetical protein AAV35_012785 [Salimicrobium jeotgali]EKE30469.1 hypothetical protein MJ3_13549 [Salimicrobium jeotgali]MBM7696615.1 hypothetical protein [Salimicrobium jeotgali]